MILTLNDYDNRTGETAIYPNKGKNLLYPALGLAEEAGEVCGKIKKVLRDHGGVFGPDEVKALEKELGDVLWYIAASARESKTNLMGVAAVFFAYEELSHLGELTFAHLDRRVASKWFGLASPGAARGSLRLFNATSLFVSNAEMGGIPADTAEANLCEVLGWTARVAKDIGSDLTKVALANLEKVEGRRARGTLGGSGDDR